MIYINKYTPGCIIRGIQLGLALKLISTSINFILQDSLIGIIAVFIIVGFYFAPILDISSLIVFMLGLMRGLYQSGLPASELFKFPELSLPSRQAMTLGFWNAGLSQIPLTIGNPVLATSLLIKDLFNKKVSESKIITSVGIMSPVASPLGGFPMCHGAGGLVAQYRFGARTGGSNILSGIILLIIAFFFASPELIKILPYGVLGALLFFSAHSYWEVQNELTSGYLLV